MIKMCCTHKLNRTSFLIIAATVCLLTSMIIDSFYAGGAYSTKFFATWVNNGVTYLYLFALGIILYLYAVRSSTIHFLEPKLQYLTYSVGPLFIMLRLVLNIINTLIAANLFNNPTVRQVIRVAMNLSAASCALYYEYYTTRLIFQGLAGSKDQFSQFKKKTGFQGGPTDFT